MRIQPLNAAIAASEAVKKIALVKIQSHMYGMPKYLK
jgi:hypothetical protein